MYDLSGRDGTPSASDVGFKAHNLMRMAALGLPVPQGFVLGTGWCRDAHSVDSAGVQLSRMLQTCIGDLERKTGLGFGSGRRPLLLSVRSGAPVSMPGMLETVLNVGLNDATLDGFLQRSGDHRLVWDSYRRLIQSFAEVVAGVPAAAFEATLDAALRASGVREATELGYRALRDLSRAYLDLHHKHTGRDFPQDPLAQLAAATRAVFASWYSPRAVEYRRLYSLSDQLGTAVTVQRMVFGNAGGVSGAGVAFTRDPALGERRLYMDFLFDAQGEDIVAGRHTAEGSSELSVIAPDVLAEIERVCPTLEAEFRDVQEFELTVEEGRLFLLQARPAKRTPWAALRIATDQVHEGLISTQTALERVEELDLGDIRRVHVQDSNGWEPLCHAIPASLGVAIGPLALDRKAAERLARAGTPAVLARADAATEDVAAMSIAAGVLTSSGSRTSHAAVVARELGKPCLVGCTDLTVDLEARTAQIAGREIAEGNVVCIEAEAGLVYAGAPTLVEERPLEALREVATWRSSRAAQTASDAGASPPRGELGGTVVG